MTVTFIELGHHGRLGNALFQIATTIGYSRKHNVPFCFPKWEHQYMFPMLSKHFIEKEYIQIINYYHEPSYVYAEIPLLKDCSLSGYFQSWKYFYNCRQYVKKVLSPTPVEDLKDYCCVHVRRGDYLNYPKHHPTQTMQYYMTAAEKIPVKKFMVFSDDIEWCRQNFKGNEFTINETESNLSDFRKMISCSNFIIANSSFSWWAAWLSKNYSKVVVAPSNWFGPKLKDSSPTTDLIPPEWIII
jgi:hypothetical protein